MNNWDIAAVGYGSIAVGTLLPVLIPMVRGVKLHSNDAVFSGPAHFSDLCRKRWDAYCPIILETLRAWKRRQAIYKYFHYYCVWWPLLTSWTVPFIEAGAKNGDAKWLIVVVSGHVTLALSAHRVFKVRELFRDYRHGESEISDLNHELQHQPEKRGKSEDEQMSAYIEAAEDIQKKVRAAETKGLASVEHGDNRST